ncbi:glycosyltransferase [Patescibacteria group bacterium]|nr:glycosyltransferase [Patescibacteria group bacterium]
MRIAILLDQLVMGGVQKIALQEALEFQKAGHDVDVLVLMREGLDKRLDEFTKDLNVRFLSDTYPLIFRRSFGIPPFSFLSTGHLTSPYLAPYVLKDNYDFIIAHGSTTCLTAKAISCKRGIPYFAFIYDPILYIFKKIYRQTRLGLSSPLLVPFIKRIEKRYLTKAISVLTQSQISQEQLNEYYNIKAHIVPSGCTPLLQTPPRRGAYLLALSRWSMKKNPQFLLEILSSIPKVTLKIAGGWESESDLNSFKQLIRKYQLDSRVELIISFNEKEKIDLFQHARAWIHPHLEGFGMGALTAASCGCPIVMPQGSGAASLFEHNKQGFFPLENDLAAFTSYINRLVKNPQLAIKMGQFAWQTVKDKYTWEKHTEKIISLTQKTVSQSTAYRQSQRSSTTPEPHQFIILETGHASSTAESGGEKIIKSLLRFLPPGFNVQVIIPPLAQGHWQTNSQKASVITLPPDPLRESQFRVVILFNYLWRIYHSLKALASANCKHLGIVYSSTNVFPDVLPAYFYKKHYPQTKWIARIHHLTPSPLHREGNFLSNTLIYLIQQISIAMIRRKADLVLVLNSSLRTKLIRQEFKAKKIKVSGAGINFLKILQYKCPQASQKWTGVFVGRLHSSKGVFDLPKIWELVCIKNPAAKLAIIGEASANTTHRLESEFEKRKVRKSNYRIFGYLPRPEMFKILKNSRVFLFCDHEAGWGIAPAEAMACGLPIIGYDLPVFGNVFKKGFITVPQFNTQAFAEQLIKLIKDKGFHQQLSDEALEQAEELDWEKVGVEFGKLVNNLMNKG